MLINNTLEYLTFVPTKQYGQLISISTHEHDEHG